MPELAPDELEALEAYGYSAPEAPQAPVARLPNPVVPLAMGTPQRFTATSAPPVFDPMEQMREQINARQFKTAQEALDAAERFQFMRAFQRDIDAGVAPDKALLRWGPGLFKKNPNVIAPMIGQTRPVPPPAVTNIAGFPVLRSGLRGERAQFAPASALPKSPLSTEVTEFRAPGTTNVLGYGIPIAEGRRQVVTPRKNDDEMSRAQTERALRAAINDAEKKLLSLPTSLKELVMVPEKDRPKQLEAANATRKALQQDIDAWSEQRNTLLRGGKTAAPAEPAKTPEAPKGPTVSNQADVDLLLKKANEAIAKGASRTNVLKWLESKGVKVKE